AHHHLHEHYGTILEKRNACLHHPARDPRHLWGRRLDPLDCVGGRHEHFGKGRQCIRRGGGRRFHVAGGRAASERAARRGADPCLERGEPPLRDDLRPGRRPRRGDNRAISRARPRSDPRHRAVGRRCSRGLRRLDAAVARLRDDAARRDSRPGDRLCRERLPCGPSDGHDNRHRRRAVPARMAEFCRGLPAERCPARTGRLFRKPALAAVYRRILSEAADGGPESQIERARQAWYSGFVAEAIDRFCRHEKVLDASGRRHGGLLTGDDMTRWEAPVEAPLTFDYHGYTVAKGGPWSQGPVLLQQLALLQGFDLDDLDPFGADFVHTVVECAKLAFADREAWYGDPDFVDVPLDLLLSREYADGRRALVGRESSAELRPGGEGWRLPGPVAPVEVAPGVGEPTRGDTVHVDVVDRWGNMVSATPSGGWLYGAPVIPSLGFCLGTRAQ